MVNVAARKAAHNGLHRCDGERNSKNDNSDAKDEVQPSYKVVAGAKETCRSCCQKCSEYAENDPRAL